MTVVQRIKESIKSHNWERALDILISELGNDEENIYILLFKGVDITFGEIYIGYREETRACSDFHLKLARRARVQKNIDVLLALSNYYTLRQLRDDCPYVRAMREIFATANEILSNNDEEAKKEIIDEFIPLIIDSFPPKSLYWTSIPYKRQIVSLFSTLASHYPEHPLLIECIRTGKRGCGAIAIIFLYKAVFLWYSKKDFLNRFNTLKGGYFVNR